MADDLSHGEEATASRLEDPATKTVDQEYEAPTSSDEVVSSDVGIGEAGDTAELSDGSNVVLTLSGDPPTLRSTAIHCSSSDSAPSPDEPPDSQKSDAAEGVSSAAKSQQTGSEEDEAAASSEDAAPVQQAQGPESDLDEFGEFDDFVEEFQEAEVLDQEPDATEAQRSSTGVPEASPCDPFKDATGGVVDDRFLQDLLYPGAGLCAAPSLDELEAAYPGLRAWDPRHVTLDTEPPMPLWQHLPAGARFLNSMGLPVPKTAQTSQGRLEGRFSWGHKSALPPAPHEVAGVPSQKAAEGDQDLPEHTLQEAWSSEHWVEHEETSEESGGNPDSSAAVGGSTHAGEASMGGTSTAGEGGGASASLMEPFLAGNGPPVGREAGAGQALEPVVEPTLADREFQSLSREAAAIGDLSEDWSNFEEAPVEGVPESLPVGLGGDTIVPYFSEPAAKTDPPTDMLGAGTSSVIQPDMRDSVNGAPKDLPSDSPHPALAILDSLPDLSHLLSDDAVPPAP
uniref:Uncharacterized protein n=1 Tax=Auxenochlorella protothecoides TaxID=3075 RepID=A0A1D2AAH3_AUXPR